MGAMQRSVSALQLQQLQQSQQHQLLLQLAGSNPQLYAQVSFFSELIAQTIWQDWGTTDWLSTCVQMKGSQIASTCSPLQFLLCVFFYEVSCTYLQPPKSFAGEEILLPRVSIDACCCKKDRPLQLLPSTLALLAWNNRSAGGGLGDAKPPCLSADVPDAHWGPGRTLPPLPVAQQVPQER